MKEDLGATYYCDCDHPDIRKTADALRAGEDDPVVIAERTFLYVRDQFPFGFDLYRRKASQILHRGHGVCWNKALLLTALLRCNRIPARFGSIPVSRSFAAPAIGKWAWLANDPFNHCFTQAYVNQRWTILDATLDRKTYEALFRPAGVIWGIDWDKCDDVRLYTESVVGPPEVHPDVDAALNRKVGNTALPHWLALPANRWVNRRMWQKAGQLNKIKHGAVDVSKV